MLKLCPYTDTRCGTWRGPKPVPATSIEPESDTTSTRTTSAKSTRLGLLLLGHDDAALLGEGMRVDEVDGLLDAGPPARR